MYTMPNKQVIVNCSYLEGSLDIGYFVIVYSQTNTTYGVVYRQDFEEFTTVSIDGSEHSLLVVYDLLSPSYPESKSAIVEPLPVSVRDELVTGNRSIQFMLSFICLCLLDARSLNVTPSISQFNVTVTTPSEGTICLSCYHDNCLGIIHSSTFTNLTLTILNYESNMGTVCSGSYQGNYSVAVFGFSSGHLDESPVYQTIVDTDSLQGIPIILFNI